MRNSEIIDFVDVGDLIALAAAIFAAAALYFAKQSAAASVRSAAAAEEQSEIQRQVRKDAAQPYVWADVRPDDATGTLLNLVVGNSGPTFAENVRLTIHPPLPAIDQLRERAETAQVLLAEGLRSLGPGRVLSWPLGQGFNLIKDEGAQACTFTITADGPFGPVPPFTYVVDLAYLRGMLDRPTGNLHQLTLAVRDLATSRPPGEAG